MPAFTVSVGVQAAEQGALEVAQMVEGADRALYIAKKLGKNRVEIAPELGYTPGADNMTTNRPLAQ